MRQLWGTDKYMLAIRSWVYNITLFARLGTRSACVSVHTRGACLHCVHVEAQRLSMHESHCMCLESERMYHPAIV